MEKHFIANRPDVVAYVEQILDSIALQKNVPLDGKIGAVGLSIACGLARVPVDGILPDSCPGAARLLAEAMHGLEDTTLLLKAIRCIDRITSFPSDLLETQLHRGTLEQWVGAVMKVRSYLVGRINVARAMA